MISSARGLIDASRLSIETYLSIRNYEGIGANLGAPIIGNIFKWEEGPVDLGAVPDGVIEDGIRKNRRHHWSVQFQRRFSRWLSGRYPRPPRLAYSLEELRTHIERQFSRGMTWGNYAGNRPYGTKRCWVVDHIVPKHLFTEQQVAEAYALSNLRPLWMAENQQKSARRYHLV